jgi:3-oxoadipate enol-lactonase
MAQIETADVTLHSDLSGKDGAPVLMFSNSLGTNLAMWDLQLASFEKHYRVLRYDMRGHGASSVPAGPYRIDQLGGDVLALLDALEIEKANFCGLSVGGLIGQWLGIHAASRLTTLTLCNTAAKIGTPDTWNQRIEDVTKGGLRAIAGKGMERWFTAPFLESDSPLVSQMRRTLIDTPPAGYIASCAAIRDTDLRNEIATIKAPTCIIAGESDPVTTVADAEFIASQIADSKLVTLPAAHISNVEAATHFNEALQNFLAQ